MAKVRERINVYEIKQNDDPYILFLDDLAGFRDVVGDIEAMSPNTKFHIRVLEVDKEWFDNLPEFDGFE